MKASIIWKVKSMELESRILLTPMHCTIELEELFKKRDLCESAMIRCIEWENR